MTIFFPASYVAPVTDLSGSSAGPAFDGLLTPFCEGFRTTFPKVNSRAVRRQSEAFPSHDGRHGGAGRHDERSTGQVTESIDSEMSGAGEPGAARERARYAESLGHEAPMFLTDVKAA
jgi:hypothetical protein